MLVGQTMEMGIISRATQKRNKKRNGSGCVKDAKARGIRGKSKESCMCTCAVCGRRRGCPDTNGHETGCGYGREQRAVISQCAACCCGVFALCSDSLVSLVGLLGPAEAVIFAITVPPPPVAAAAGSTVVF